MLNDLDDVDVDDDDEEEDEDDRDLSGLRLRKASKRGPIREIIRNSLIFCVTFSN